MRRTLALHFCNPGFLFVVLTFFTQRPAMAGIPIRDEIGQVPKKPGRGCPMCGSSGTGRTRPRSPQGPRTHFGTYLSPRMSRAILAPKREAIVESRFPDTPVRRQSRGGARKRLRPDNPAPGCARDLQERRHRYGTFRRGGDPPGPGQENCLQARRKTARASIREVARPLRRFLFSPDRESSWRRAFPSRPALSSRPPAQ